MDKVISNEKYEIYRLSIELANTSHFTNCYVVKDLITGYMMVIDPSYNAEYIKECLEKIGVTLDKIYLTHCHGDHISALEELFNMYDKKVNILIHENDKNGIFDDMKNCKYILGVPNFSTLKEDDINTVKDSETVKVGNTSFEVIHTPGHTNGSSVLYEKEEDVILSGDTIFSDCFGRTDLKSGSRDDMVMSLNKLFDRFKDNPKVKVFPGHGNSDFLGNIKKAVLY